MLTKPSHASAGSKFIATCVDQIPPMPASTHNISELPLKKPLPYQGAHKIYFNLCWQNPSHAKEDTKCNLICVDQGHNMAAWTHKIHLNKCWQNPSHDSEDTKCISTCVDQTPSTPVTTHIASQHVLTKPLTSKRGHKMHLILYSLYPCKRGHKMHLNKNW